MASPARANQEKRLHPVEVKSSVTATPALLKNLGKWKHLGNRCDGPETLIYFGDTARQMGVETLVPRHAVGNLSVLAQFTGAIEPYF